MDRIENNEATEYVYGSYFGYDFDTESLPQIEDMEAMDTASTFCEYVYLHAVRCNPAFRRCEELCCKARFFAYSDAAFY